MESFIDRLQALKVINPTGTQSINVRNKKMLVDFWYIECPGCVKQLKLMDKLADKFATDTSVQFIAIANGAINKQDQVKKFVRSNQYKFTILYDSAGLFSHQQSISEYPQQFLFNSKMELSRRSIGFNNDEAIIYVQKTSALIKEMQ